MVIYIAQKIIQSILVKKMVQIKRVKKNH